ncbi:MAG: magnesium transporter CorA family protein [Deltaproteobacteria bacterium]|jgi:magnesium transporter|nr:magnesium transporter CorA family protein [Deltaproteobacteria bacterium]
MITGYRFHETSWEEVTAGEEPDWLDLEKPEPDELAELASRLDLPPHFLTDPLDPRERPRLDDETGCFLIIVRAPLIREDLQSCFETVPLGFIQTQGRILTICREPGLVKQFLSRQTRKPRRISGDSLIFKAFIEISTDFIHQLEVLEDLAEEAERHLSKSQHNDQIMTLLTIEKALINYSVALHSNRAILEKLMSRVAFPLKEEQVDWLERALTENQQAIFTVEIFGQIVGSMGDAFGVIISNNLNKVMKFLTGVTIILMVPTLIVGAYGMNVSLPIAERWWAFYALSALCLALSVAIWVFFYRKKWI